MRPTWDETWMQVADMIALRSLCVRRQAGTVLVDADQRIVATGYNGPPRGYAAVGTCNHWCERAITGGSLSYDDCVSAHSEANALMHADRSRMEGGTAYITSCPCFTCAKNLSNSGIARAVFRVTEVDRDRKPELSIAMMKTSGIETVDFDWDLNDNAY